MIVPVIYPSAGEFWLNSNSDTFLNRRLAFSDLPDKYRFTVTSKISSEVAGILGLSLPLYLTAPEDRFKRRCSSCVINSRTLPFPPESFLHISRGKYDIYIARPELCFLQAARYLDLIDLIRFGYDLCSIYSLKSSAEQSSRNSPTTIKQLKEYVLSNHSFYGASKATAALRYVRERSNSPMETKLAIFSVLPPRYGGCGISHFELNKEIALTSNGKRLVGYACIHGDLVFNRGNIVVEYNSKLYHLDPDHYTDDMNRQTALKMAGYKYTAITAGNVKTYHSLINIMNAIRAELSLPMLDEPNDARTELYFRLFK